MAAFLIFDQLRTFYGQSGQLLAGGNLKFYLANTTTPASVYGNKALSVNNGATITLDSSGRPSAAGAPTSIWANTTAAYFVELFDSSNVKQGEIQNVEVPGGTAQTVPVPAAGYFLTGDGTNFSTATIRAVPDPTGNANKILGNDGTSSLWQAANAANALDYQVVTAATTTTVDLTLGCAILLNQAVDITTLAFTNPPSTTKAYIVTITRVKDATGTARLISNLSTLATWPAGVPTLTQTTGAIDQLSIKFEPSVAKGRGTYALALS